MESKEKVSAAISFAARDKGQLHLTSIKRSIDDNQHDINREDDFQENHLPGL